MAEVQTYTFDYKEVAEALIKQQGLHEGLWGVYMEFGIGAANIPAPGTSQGTLLPAAIVPVVKIGLQRHDKPNPMSVDAATINPLTTEPVIASGNPPPARGRRNRKALRRE